ncbi:MAG TPA: hypothetical protein DCS97_16005 [Planctomycetes bacterium]|nr:hypothetical protein [Planctomycetota bacterium]
MLALCCAGLAGEELQLVPLAPTGGFTGGEGNVYPPGWTLAPLRKVSISSQSSRLLCLKQDGTVVGWGNYGRGGNYPPPEGPALDISSGAFYQAAAMADGSVRVWGWSSTEPNPSSPPVLSDATAVAMDAYTGYALRADGSVVSWPNSRLPPVNNGFTRINSGPFGLRAGELVAWGGWETTYPPPSGLVLGADAGGGGAVAIRADGSAVRWVGSGPALPVGPWSDVAVSGDTSLLRRSDGRVVAHSYFGTSERAGSAGSLSMDTDGALSAVVRADGSLDLWHGYNPLPAGPKGIGRVDDAVLANGGGLALLDDGSLLSWGGTTWTTPTGSGFVSIAASNQAGYAVRADGTVATFGYNGHGTSYPADAVLVRASSTHAAVLCRDGRVEMRSMYAGYSDTTAALSGSLALATGDGWTLGLKPDGSVVGWGPDATMAVRNIPGDIGQVVQLTGYGDFALVRRADGTLRAWGALASVPPAITDAVDIAACNGAFVVLRADGTVLVWEKPGRLRTVQPAATDRVRKVCGGANPIALRTPAPLLRGHPDSGTAGTVTIPALWNWPVTGFAADDVVVGNGGVVAVTGSGDTYAIEVRPAGPGPVTVEVRRGAAVNALGWPSMEARTVYQALPLTATPLTVGVPEGGSVEITVPNPNAPTLVTPALGTGPAHGTLGSFVGDRITYTPVSGYVGSDAFTYQLGNGAYWSDPATVTLTVRLTNWAPTLDQPGDALLHEDAGSLNLSLTGIGPGRALEAGQVLGITTSSSAPGIVPPPAVTYISPGTSGGLTIVPVANAFGSADITVTVSDDGGTADGGSNQFQRTFRVVVTPVNDAPTLAFIPGSSIGEDGPEQVLTLTGIGPGPVNEAGQVLAIEAFSTDPALVGIPVVTYAGGTTATLRWRPQPDANGSARIFITVIDDAGTADGGADSVSQSFPVTVSPENDAPTATVATWQVNPATSNAISPAHLAISDVDEPAPETLVATITALPAAGTLTIDGATASVGSTFTWRDLLDTDVRYQAPGSAGNHSLGFAIGDGVVAGVGPYNLPIMVTDAISNLPPVLVLGGFASWQESQPPVLVDPNAEVSDGDSPLGDLPVLSGGVLTATVTLNSTGAERLSIGQSGGVTLNAGRVAVNGVEVGTVTSGDTGPTLSVTLNAAATPVRVTRVARAISFAVDATAPGTSTRRVTVQVSDGTSASAAMNADVEVIEVNSPPELGLTAITLINEGGTAVFLDSNATCVDEDSGNFDGGQLTVGFNGFREAEDLLAFGTTEKIAIVGDKINHTPGGELGTWSLGDLGSLVVTLGANATPELVGDLLRAVTMRNISENPTAGTRVVEVTLNDGDGGIGSDDIGVYVAAINDAPTVTISDSAVIWRQGDSPTLIDGLGLVGDIDSPDFENGRLTASLSAGGNATDRLTITDYGPVSVTAGTVAWSGTAIGTVTGGDPGTTPLVVSLLATATRDRVQDLLRALAFSSTATLTTTQDRTVAVVLEDGDGGTSLQRTREVQVVQINLPPSITLSGGSAAYTEDTAAVALDDAASVSDPEGDVAGGVLTIIPEGADDRLSIANQGVAAGQIGVSGTQVTWGNTPLGTWSGGSGSALTINLAQTATPAGVQDLLRAVRYASVAQNPPANRSIGVTLNDGDGGTSDLATRSVAITPVNDAPTASPTVLTVLGQDASGTWTGSDAEGHALTWIVVGQPTNGTLSVDATLGTWSFTPSAAGSSTATVDLFDGIATTVLTVPVVVTAPTDPRPVVISDPPLSVQIGQTWTWELRLADTDLAAQPDLEIEAIGAPAGLGITIVDGHHATLAWPVPGGSTAGSHVWFHLRISDRVSGRSGLQPVLIHLRSLIGGGG